jgi:hypothetical protein
MHTQAYEIGEYGESCPGSPGVLPYPPRNREWLSREKTKGRIKGNLKALLLSLVWLVHGKPLVPEERRQEEKLHVFLCLLYPYTVIVHRCSGNLVSIMT